MSIFQFKRIQKPGLGFFFSGIFLICVLLDCEREDPTDDAAGGRNKEIQAVQAEVLERDTWLTRAPHRHRQACAPA